VVDRYRRKFDTLLDSAIPGAFVVGELRRVADTLISSALGALDADEISWLHSIVDLGEHSKFAKENGWSTERVQDVQARALRAHLVRANHVGNLIPAYPIDEAGIRRAFNAISGRVAR
jgi:hypothetical protein